MNERVKDLWKRANKALLVARTILPVDADTAASKAYYAAFYAVSARFALRDEEFRKHSAMEAAVHRNLVKAGIWPVELGQGYSRLAEARTIGDYGEGEHVSDARAAEALEIAARILQAVAAENPTDLPLPEDRS
jgi:uncharacterized protein (UPF0332 family)